MWVDFALVLAEADYHFNFLIEIEDLEPVTSGDNPSALSLHMFEDGEIPETSEDQTATQLLQATAASYYLLSRRKSTASFY